MILTTWINSSQQYQWSSTLTQSLCTLRVKSPIISINKMISMSSTMSGPKYEGSLQVKLYLTRIASKTAHFSTASSAAQWILILSELIYPKVRRLAMYLGHYCHPLQMQLSTLTRNQYLKQLIDYLALLVYKRV